VKVGNCLKVVVGIRSMAKDLKGALKGSSIETYY